MKIKTIRALFDQSERFDAEVNSYLAKGWVLRKRAVIQGMPYSQTDYARRVLYAELEMPDKEETVALSKPLNPFEAARMLQEYCRARGGSCQGCKFHFGGCSLTNRMSPSYWRLPEGTA